MADTTQQDEWDEPGEREGDVHWYDLPDDDVEEVGELAGAEDDEADEPQEGSVSAARALEGGGRMKAWPIVAWMRALAGAAR